MNQQDMPVVDKEEKWTSLNGVLNANQEKEICEVIEDKL